MSRTRIFVTALAACMVLWATVASAGIIVVTSFQMPTGAASNCVLTCDATGAGTWQQVSSAMIQDGAISNADVSATAAIAPSKISGTAWTSTNDGSGSGLDADLLDGQQASDFASASHNHLGETWTGSVTYGLRAETSSTIGRGLCGYATASSGTTYGVYGITSSTSGWGGHFSGGKGLYGSRLALNTTSPECYLHVKYTLDDTEPYAEVGDHVACIENTDTAGNCNVLALRINQQDPSGPHNFITFYDSDGPVGAIHGDGSGGIVVGSGGADFAEYVPKRRPDEALSPGDIVGLCGGRVSKATRGAQRAMVVTTAPIVLGNRPEPDQESEFAAVTFVGQTPVKVRGAVQVGDFIVPSGREDGTGVAVAPQDLTVAQAAQVVARALEAADGARVSRVKALVGLPHDQAWQTLLQKRDGRVADLEARVEAVQALVNDSVGRRADARRALLGGGLLAGGLLMGGLVLSRRRKEVA